MFHTLGVLWSSAKPILGILVGDFFVCLGGFCFGSLGGKGRERVVGFWFGFLFFLGGLFVLEWFLLLLLFPFWFFVCFVDFSWFLGCLFVFSLFFNFSLLVVGGFLVWYWWYFSHFLGHSPTTCVLKDSQPQGSFLFFLGL